MLKLGLTQRVEVVESYGERRDCLDQEWTQLLSAAGYLPVPLPNRFEAAASLVAELDLAGLVLTGGNDPADLEHGRNIAPERDRLEHRLIELATARRLPLLGVCRGLQMLVVHFGGQLSAVDGHVARPHALHARPDTPMPLSDRDEVNSFHNFGIAENDVGTELRVAATAPDGTVEAVAHRSLPQWGVMWHPERQPKDGRDLEIFASLFPVDSP